MSTPGETPPRGNVVAAGDLSTIDEGDEVDDYPMSILIQFPDEASVRHALNAGFATFTVFGGTDHDDRTDD